MEYIALEEAFDIPELTALRADIWSGMRMRRRFLEHVRARLTDFTEYRLPEMDEYNVTVQVLSLTVPCETTKDAIEGFERTTLSRVDREKIAYRNAAALLKIR